MNLPLYYQAKTNNYYYKIDISISCSKCNKIIELNDMFCIQKSYSKVMPTETYFFCISCAGSNKKKDLDIFTIARVTSVLPRGSVLVIDRPIRLNNADFHIFEAYKQKSERETDRTIYAGRETIMGASVGDLSFKKHNPKENKYLSNEGALNKILGARPLIDHKKNKLLN